MKKSRSVTLLILITMFAMLVLVGCKKKEENISYISLKDNDPNSAIEIAVGDFDYDKFTIVVTNESGSTEEITLTEEMISETDLFKLYQVGDHNITVNYGDQQYTFKVSVKRSTFGELKFPENNVFVYDGKEHTIEVDGNIPANADVTYIGGNSFVNAGKYDVTAVVSCEGYVTQKVSTTVTIERAKYDMSNVKFEGKEVVYDGKAHSIEISGELPKGVSSPTYTINEIATANVTEVGEYKVKAIFANEDTNYEDIPAMEAVLKITHAEYSIKGVDIVFENENGNIISGGTKIYDGKSVTFDLNDYNKLSKKISVMFFVCDEDGNIISKSNENTNIINSGVYTVKAEFTLADGKNYKPIAPIIRTFEVLDAEYPSLTNINVVSGQVSYDGKAHSVQIEGELPKGVTVSYEYYLDGELVLDGEGNPAQAVVAVGVYTVKAVFTHDNENFSKIPDILTTFSVQKKTISLNAIGFFGPSSVEYSGEVYEPPFTTWNDVNPQADYDIFKYGAVRYYKLVTEVDSDSGENISRYVEMEDGELPRDVGSYRAVIDVSVAEDWNHIYDLEGDDDVQEIVKQFEIKEKQ